MSREMSCLYKTFYRCPTYGENCGEKCRIYRETHQTKENINDEGCEESGKELNMSDDRTFKEVFMTAFPIAKTYEHCCHNTVQIEYKARGKRFYCYIPQELWDMPYKDLEGVKQ